MSASQLLIQNLTELLTASSTLVGGNKINNSASNKSPILFLSLLLILFVLIIKGYIVYLVYNYLMPKLIYSLSSSINPVSLEYIENHFKTITFSESILLVILFNTLFSF
jgi:hypothetical protein